MGVEFLGVADSSAHDDENDKRARTAIEKEMFLAARRSQQAGPFGRE